MSDTLNGKPFTNNNKCYLLMILTTIYDNDNEKLQFSKASCSNFMLQLRKCSLFNKLKLRKSNSLYFKNYSW